MVPFLFLPFGATFQSLSSTSPDLDGVGIHLAPSRLRGVTIIPEAQQDPRVLGVFSLMDGIIVGGYSELGGTTLGG